MRDFVGIVAAALCGLLFGFGLIASQMSDPMRIIAFLDIAGSWDPRLLMVMVSASVVAAPAFAMARRNKQSWLGDPISLPDRTRIDRPLIIGAAIFGVGWGLAGLCPGPALVLLGTVRDIGAWIFVPALIVGSFLGRLGQQRMTAAVPKPG
jgi:uncharacterized membrane protein YedE/YeeE